jgi:hypothetical protein
MSFKYAESVVEASDQNRLLLPAQQLLKPLVLVALNICKMEQFTGRTEPTVITWMHWQKNLSELKLDRS